MGVLSYKLLSKNHFFDFRFHHLDCYCLPLMKAAILPFALLILITFFYGCIILPVPYHSEDPFPDETKSLFIPGSTTKTAINENFGNFLARRLGERIYIYAGKHRHWALLYFIGFGPAGDMGVGSSYETHLFIVEFDKNNIVTAAEEICGNSGELKSGLYVVNSGGRGFGKTSWRFVDKNLILRATQNMDKQAKQFVVPPNKSVIYYYKKFSDNVEATLDDNLSVDPESNGFLMWVVDPGEHRINTTHNFYWDGLTIYCYPGKKYYIENYKGTLKEEDKAIAEKEISQRKLVIDRIDTFDFD